MIKNKIINKTYVRKKGKLPDGIIAQKLLNDYFLGIITVMINRNIFKSYKFNENYNIIGDFDLFFKLSTKYKFHSSQKSLAIYNVHGKNMSLVKLKTYTKELNNWIKKNEKKLSNKFNINKIKFLLMKLKIKSFLNYFL